jgi:hypothetical protein
VNKITLSVESVAVIWRPALSPQPPAVEPGKVPPGADVPSVPPVPKRPWEVYALLIAIGLFWGASSFSYLTDGDGGENVGYLVFWTVVVLLCMWRIAVGGAMAISRLSTIVGVIGLAGLAFNLWVVYKAITAEPDDLLWDASDAVDVLPIILVSAVLVVVAQFQRRRTVIEWVRARELARRAARPGTEPEPGRQESPGRQEPGRGQEPGQGS